MSFKKSMLISLLFASTSLFTIPEPSPTITLNINNLILNNSSNYRISVSKNEIKGIKDIRRMLDSHGLEDAWLYLPKKEIWKEVGISSKYYEVYSEGKKIRGINAKIDEKYLEKIILENDEIILYHTHTTLNDINDVNKKTNNSIKKKISIIEMKSLFGDTSPSPHDISSMIKYSSLFYKLHPKGNFSYKICSKRGITGIFLTKKGRTGAIKNKQFLEYKIKFTPY